jgi:hypothetical protein
VVDMHVDPLFLPREEVESEPSVPEHRGDHSRILHQNPSHAFSA